MDRDLQYIHEAIALAELGRGQVSPNPLVGAVVVQDGEIVGRGFHRYADQHHAEALALREAGDRSRGATVYVNLEPCAHHGRTPPCAEAIVEAGVARVVASMRDPNPRVFGRGFDRLRDAGIEVSVGLGEKEARRLNEVFVTFFTAGRPFVHLKSAVSLDGQIATRTGDSQWITGDDARLAGQELRHAYDALLVGIGTVLADDPLLTDRTGRPRPRPLARIVLDSTLRLPLASNLVRTVADAPVIVFCLEAAAGEKRRLLAERGVEIVSVPVDPATGRLALPAIMAALAERNVTSVLIEGGADVAGAFVPSGLVDKVTFFVAPMLIGGQAARGAVGGEGFARLSDAMRLVDLTTRHIGRDIEITGYPVGKGE